MFAFLFWAKGGDDVTQSTQTSINLFCFFEPLASCSRIFDSFRSSQINQVQAAGDLAVSAFIVSNNIEDKYLSILSVFIASQQCEIRYLPECDRDDRSLHCVDAVALRFLARLIKLLIWACVVTVLGFRNFYGFQNEASRSPYTRSGPIIVLGLINPKTDEFLWQKI